MAKYIANLTVVNGNIGTSNITMEYQNGDFFGGTPTAASTNIWYYNQPGGGTSQWISTAPQTSNGTDGSNITIVKNSAALTLTAPISYPLNVAQVNNDPGAANNTW